MKRRTLLAMMIFAISAELVGTRVLDAQQGDPRVMGLIKAHKIRAAVGMNPTIALKDLVTGELRGPALDLARALADRIGVKLITVEYPSPGLVLQGIERQAWDVTFLVIDPGRADAVDFSTPYMESDFTYLVPVGSPIGNVADVDRPGIRIAVVRNDASDLSLSRSLKHAELVRADDINAAVELLRTGQVQAAAAPRPVLLVESTKLASSRVLDDGFAKISWAVVVPKGQTGLLAYVSEFVEDAKASGLVKRTIDANRLRGVKVAPISAIH